MSASQAEVEDALNNLRLAINQGIAPTLSSGADPVPANIVSSIAAATHVSFHINEAHRTFPFTSATRFAPDNRPVDLRSCYFAWLNKDASLTDYFAAVQAINEELPSGAGGSVQILTFAQKIELIAWLAGETENSDSIIAIDSHAASAAASDAAAIAGGKGVPMDKDMKRTGAGKMVDVRLLQIYDGERRMGDHNTALRGSKLVDFEAFRKVAAQRFLRKGAGDPNSIPQSLPQSTALVSNLQRKPTKRLEPIILISPSASSLLRMANAKRFLDDGVFAPVDTNSASMNMVRIQRVMPSISSSPMTFILVDSTTSFKPTYWSRIVAIFTTGQTWQFKTYKYTNPAELFSHYPGIFVGWSSEEPPENVLSLGRGVMPVKVDKWTGTEKGRWRDREVVERIWGRIEEGMRRGGWTKDGPGLAGQQPRR